MKRRTGVEIKKLKLRKDTLKRLSDGSLREAAGGDGMTYEWASCPVRCTPTYSFNWCFGG